MKRISTKIDNEYHEKFIKICKEKGYTPYEALKISTMKFIDENEKESLNLDHVVTEIKQLKGMFKTLIDEQDERDNDFDKTTRRILELLGPTRKNSFRSYSLILEYISAQMGQEKAKECNDKVEVAIKKLSNFT